MGEQKNYNSSSGTPIQLRTHAARNTEGSTRSRQTTRQPREVDDDNSDAWTVAKPHTSAVTYTHPYPRRTMLLEDPKKTWVIKQRRVDRTTLVKCVCLLFLIMVGGWWLFSTVTNWWTGVQDDWKYGSIRTYQTDQFVDQGDSPDHPDHFIVVNTHGQVVVVQLNPQHPNLDHIYGITTTSDPKTPVSLTFRPTGNTVAMYVLVGDMTPYTVELVSDGTKFVSPH